MGSQVNFYLVPEDEEVFCRYIASDPSVVILYATHLEQPLVPVTLPPLPATTPYCSRFALWNREVASEAEVRPPGKVPDYGNPHGCYDIHAMVYPVIELMRSGLKADGLGPGRIWTDLDRRNLAPEKQKLFRAWFRRLARKLNQLPFRYDMYRIGPKTKEYFDKGGKAIGYGLGEIKCVEASGDVRVVRRGVEVDSFSPKVERDDGEEDLTIDRY